MSFSTIKYVRICIGSEIYILGSEIGSSYLEYELLNSSEATAYKSYFIKNANLTNIRTCSYSV